MPTPLQPSPSCSIPSLSVSDEGKRCVCGRRFGTVLALAFFLLLLALNLLLGSVSLSHVSPDMAQYILWHLRLPEVLMALAAGIGLSLSGLVMQTLMGNPLADPSVLGVTAGASLGSGLVMLAGSALGLSAAQTAMGGMLQFSAFVAAFLAAVAVTCLLVFFSRRVVHRTTLLLVGVMLNFVLSSLIGVLSFYASPDGIQHFVVWGLGTLGGVPLPLALIALTLMIICALLIYIFRAPLNAFLLGEPYVATVGYDVRRLRTLFLLFVSFQCALVTSLCGPIAFIGLAVPHLARTLVKSDAHQRVIPATILWGCIVMLACRLLCLLPTLVWGTGILPLNVLTPLFGAPVVLWVLLRRV